MLFGAMEMDGPSRSSFRTLSTAKKRIADENLREDSEEPVVLTPPQGARVPAKLRLSVSRKQMDILVSDSQQADIDESSLNKRKRALFGASRTNSKSPDSLLPPPDFEAASYPKGWGVGKKRKLVNVDVVESMRRIAVHEMNRKDREIIGLNGQLEEDSRTMEYLQLQLQQERSKRLQAERENAILQGQIAMLVNIIDEGEEMDVTVHES
ncbi:hypothetical protein O6H91_09G018600 [Diphasiastrum complanatum]|uniref:Uncharacterized protein n=3 Tax=Diphasiastrum complanatum TaxID=34168 RepID=A0ACC2CLV9_DIPCM|nr:hypothetical protein O6H91_09G018300 [Diphasiastrum complanatum]KAJ7542936.1 hypothetical protein O6H91_09G018300 [Diphasiastrum complanatum]KAJ7542943.1 hypothetical protein O6H91_09G018600 [Diphasiastrum complanatum]